jgi:serine phosphatase RsbU (regulator of sigma subunit)
VRFGDSQRTVELGVLLILDMRVNPYSSSLEFGSGETKLVIAVASMLGAVLGSRKVAESARSSRMAKVIQQQILPAEPGKVPGFEIAGRCMTSGAVGGDYFDYLLMADGRQMVVVADVSGHNLASGMLMVSARATLRILAAVNTNLVDVSTTSAPSCTRT